MANRLPPTLKLPLDREALESGDPARLARYVRTLLMRLTAAYEEIAQVVNENWEKRNEP